MGFLPSVAYPVCAAGGLICFLSPNFDTGYTSLLVCNPVTRKWKELPAMLNYNRVPFLVSMVVDKEKLGYKVRRCTIQPRGRGWSAGCYLKARRYVEA